MIIGLIVLNTGLSHVGRWGLANGESKRSRGLSAVASELIHRGLTPLSIRVEHQHPLFGEMVIYMMGPARP